MPTNQNVYNTRLTDEALEKRFRDTFRSQGGAELVDDLYASGVIIPVVDFTQAAEGSQLPQNLQTAWDFSTGHSQVNNGNTTIINTAGFWKIDFTAVAQVGSTTTSNRATISLSDGLTSKVIWQLSRIASGTNDVFATLEQEFNVFVNSGESISVAAISNTVVDVWYRQIATVSGDLVNPSGFTSS